MPNEDSQLPEFDETNLFSLNRFPGEDRLETGLRANLGVSYTRYAPGRLVDRRDARPGDPRRAAATSSPTAAASRAAGRTTSARSTSTSAPGSRRSTGRRSAPSSTSGATSSRWPGTAPRAGLIATYVYLAEVDGDPYLGPEPATSELSLDARYRVHPNWEVRGLWRYDLESGSNLRAGAGVSYGNECAEFDLSVSRRYTSSDNVPPSTSIGFSLQLAGIGEDGRGTGRRASACRRGPERRRGDAMRIAVGGAAGGRCWPVGAPARRRQPLRAGDHRQRRGHHPLRHRPADARCSARSAPAATCASSRWSS